MVRCDVHRHRAQMGDACTVDDDGYYHVMSRIDDGQCRRCTRALHLAPVLTPPLCHDAAVINVAGHRLSTGAIEAAIASHP